MLKSLNREFQKKLRKKNTELRKNKIKTEKNIKRGFHSAMNQDGGQNRPFLNNCIVHKALLIVCQLLKTLFVTTYNIQKTIVQINANEPSRESAVQVTVFLNESN